jgi:hypothetical protein
MQPISYILKEQSQNSLLIPLFLFLYSGTLVWYMKYSLFDWRYFPGTQPRRKFWRRMGLYSGSSMHHCLYCEALPFCVWIMETHNSFSIVGICSERRVTRVGQGKHQTQCLGKTSFTRLEIWTCWSTLFRIHCWQKERVFNNVQWSSSQWKTLQVGFIWLGV